jgi:ATP-dependent 26S proteasome regulatory subunit
MYLYFFNVGITTTLEKEGRCPHCSNQDNISVDQLIPNKTLRKAIEVYIREQEETKKNQEEQQAEEQNQTEQEQQEQQEQQPNESGEVNNILLSNTGLFIVNIAFKGQYWNSHSSI